MVIRSLIYWGLPSLALVINGVLLLLLSLSKKDRLIRSFIPFIAVMIAWAASSLLMKIQFYPSVLFWNRVMVASITMVPYFAYIFVSIFTNQIKKSSILAWSLIILVIQIMNIMGIMVTSAEMVPVIINGVETYELIYALGPWSYVGFGSVFVLLAVSLNKMRKAFKRGETHSNKLRPVMLGYLFFMLA